MSAECMNEGTEEEHAAIFRRELERSHANAVSDYATRMKDIDYRTSIYAAVGKLRTSPAVQKMVADFGADPPREVTRMVALVKSSTDAQLAEHLAYLTRGAERIDAYRVSFAEFMPQPDSVLLDRAYELTELVESFALFMSTNIAELRAHPLTSC
jgi:hypothetical protein